MSVLAGANNVTINGGNFTALSIAAANGSYQNDIVALLHSHSATAGLLDAKGRFAAPECHEGTRTSMILEMKKFVQDGDAASLPALYWLHGPVGVGKSALAQTVSLLLKREGDHAASFFFSRTSPGCNNGNQLVVTLAYQLATNFRALRRFMLKAVRDNPAILTASNAVQMESLIVNPINKWQKKYNRSIWKWIHQFNNKKVYPRLILADGLDECDDPQVQIDLILCIASAVSQLSIPLRFVITSRLESHIVATFEQSPVFCDSNGLKVTKKNLGEDEDADEQITAFLLEEFTEIRRTHPVREYLPQEWPRPDQIRQLVSKSSQGFIYPTTVTRYIKMPYNRPDECLNRILGLSEIPAVDKPYEPLDFLYRHIFESLPVANKTSIHNIFHFLVIPSAWDGVNDPKTIEGYFGYPPGHVRHVLRDLLCLVEFDSIGRIKILHASLPDFLLDRSRSGPLCIDASNAHAAIAGGYLSSIYSRDGFLSRDAAFIDFLDHMIQANMSDTLLCSTVSQINLLPYYRGICAQEAIYRYIYYWKSPSQFMSPAEQVQAQRDIEAIAFMIAYLLVLVIHHGRTDYIRDQVTAIKAHVLELYPGILVLNDKIIPIMAPLFHNWTSTIYHENIKHIFACEISPFQNELCEAVFELQFLMMAQFNQRAMESSILGYSAEGRQTEHPEQRSQKAHNFWANIVKGVHDSSNFTPTNPT